MVDSKSTPQHIAFIMDGNGRWAQGRGLVRLEGHRRGVKTVRNIIEACAEREIPYVTLWAFSTKNWKRPNEEVSGLFSLMREFFRTQLADLHKNQVRIRFLGNRTPAGGLPEDIRELIEQVEAETAMHKRITVAIALNYTGREELMRAMQLWAADVAAGKITAAELNEQTVSNYLDTTGMPDPDLIVRTGGEQRLSDFLPWQIGDAELLFHPNYWPSFTVQNLQDCLDDFAGRDRRFGGLSKAKKAAVVSLPEGEEEVDVSRQIR